MASVLLTAGTTVISTMDLHISSVLITAAGADASAIVQGGATPVTKIPVAAKAGTSFEKKANTIHAGIPVNGPVQVVVTGAGAQVLVEF